MICGGQTVHRCSSVNMAMGKVTDEDDLPFERPIMKPDSCWEFWGVEVVREGTMISENVSDNICRQRFRRMGGSLPDRYERGPGKVEV